MLQKTFSSYLNNFRGFSKEIWILTLMTFINRAGTMVLPFLSKYLKEDLHFSYDEVMWIIIFFGLGSMLGAWLGGKLSDKIGFYKVMIFSLLTSGVLFFFLQYVTSFIGLSLSIFLIMTIADMFRPAMFVSLGSYALPENRTRALVLVRLAINLGFAAGPALGGLIIMGIGYNGLFWVDGATCILSILVFWIFVKEHKNKTISLPIKTNYVSSYSILKDIPFIIFIIAFIISGILFFQIFNTIPIYHKVQFNLTEFQTGLLITLNGLIVFIFEMPLVNYIEQKKINLIKIMTFGLLAMTISLFLMLVNNWAGILVFMMVFMAIGQMLLFPFSNSFTMTRAPKGLEGRYMAIYSMSYSLAHILSAIIGYKIVAQFGYQTIWLVMGLLGIVSVILAYWVKLLLATEMQESKNKK